MEEHEEGGLTQTLAIGCPIALGLALVGVLLVVLIGAVILSFAL